MRHDQPRRAGTAKDGLPRGYSRKPKIHWLPFLYGLNWSYEIRHDVLLCLLHRLRSNGIENKHRYHKLGLNSPANQE
jgi:hypothetical protein